MTASLLTTILVAATLVLVEASIFINYWRRLRRPAISSTVAYRTPSGIDLVWALCPPVFLAVLIALTLQTNVASGSGQYGSAGELAAPYGEDRAP